MNPRIIGRQQPKESTMLLSQPCKCKEIRNKQQGILRLYCWYTPEGSARTFQSWRQFPRGMASSVKFGFGIFAARFFPRTAITKKHRYVNEASYSQDYSDDLTETPGVLARFDVRPIAMSLRYAWVCIPFSWQWEHTYDQLEGRNTVHRISYEMGGRFQIS